VYARVLGERLTPGRVQAAADAACPCGDAWVWNQCLMDLGAVLCRPSAPNCEECPLATRCQWHRAAGPDPAVGSAGVSVRQARFQGSDREARGRLMKALLAGPVHRSDVASVMERDEQTASRLVAALLWEGLCQADRLTICLPN
jgi:A/G-specific adenine glycosylase